MSTNIVYQNSDIAEFYSQHRITWNEFYPSERFVFESVAARENGLGSVLDAGCAVGGLGRALAEKKLISSYTGLDINAQAIELAQAVEFPNSIPQTFMAADVLTAEDLPPESFDTVVSLSCIDWNVETTAMLRRCWELVAPGGRFILSTRLTNDAGQYSLEDSHQFIRFDGTEPDDAEVAPYVVFNWNDLLGHFSQLSPTVSHMLGYGYWGKPSEMAQTPLDRIVFAVFALSKGRSQVGEDDNPTLELKLPWALWQTK